MVPEQVELDWIQQRGQEGMNMVSELIDDRFGAKTTENIIQSAGNLAGQTATQAEKSMKEFEEVALTI